MSITLWMIKRIRNSVVLIAPASRLWESWRTKSDCPTFTVMIMKNMKAGANKAWDCKVRHHWSA